MLIGQELYANFATHMDINSNYSLLNRNTFGINVFADCFAEYNDISELKSLLQTVKGPLFCMGGGSNLLFMNDFHGTILHSCIKTIEIIEENESSVFVKVGSGVVWDDFVDYCVVHGLWGVENLSSIPGEVGASAVQNIGAYGVEAKDVIVKVDAVCLLDGSEGVFTNEECKYDYRSSLFKTELKGRFSVSYVTYELKKKANPKLDYGLLKQTIDNMGNASLQNIRDAVCLIRNSKLPDPKILGNAGSFFKNPVITDIEFKRLQNIYPDIPFFLVTDKTIKVPAGWLIEKSGWKGRSLGSAAVHDKQALVLVNLGGATGNDVKRLADNIISDVKGLFDIMLETEVNYI
jgi:UDP-N-acetylmuramate dehydrogenase